MIKRKSLERYLRENINKNIIDHTIRARQDENGNIVFYIHPANVNGDTLDYLVEGNQLEQLQNKDNIVVNINCDAIYSNDPEKDINKFANDIFTLLKSNQANFKNITI